MHPRQRERIPEQACFLLTRERGRPASDGVTGERRALATNRHGQAQAAAAHCARKRIDVRIKGRVDERAGRVCAPHVATRGPNLARRAKLLGNHEYARSACALAERNPARVDRQRNRDDQRARNRQNPAQEHRIEPGNECGPHDADHRLQAMVAYRKAPRRFRVVPRWRAPG